MKRKDDDQAYVFPIEEETRFLLLPAKENADKAFDDYLLLILGQNEHEYDEFMPVACACIEALFDSFIAVSDFPYDPYLKQWFKRQSDNRASEPGTYQKKIIGYVTDHPESGAVFQHIGDLKNLRLSVAKRDITADFIKAAYMDTFAEKYKHNHYQLVFYGIKPDRCKELSEALDESVPCDICVYYDSHEDSLNISLRIAEYAKDKLVEILRKVIERYGRKLEVRQ